MTTTPHTPGPWTLDATVNGWTLLANGGEITADHFDCTEADAHLIAAAPDLLAACIDALEVEEDMAGCPDSELAKRLRAAIAKAKGETA